MMSWPVLADSVNSMTQSIEELVQKIKEDERKMRRADLRLLQEQINPHFLYNTLDTIVWLIEGNDPDKAVNCGHVFVGVFSAGAVEGTGVYHHTGGRASY